MNFLKNLLSHPSPSSLTPPPSCLTLLPKGVLPHISGQLGRGKLPSPPPPLQVASPALPFGVGRGKGCCLWILGKGREGRRGKFPPKITNRKEDKRTGKVYNSLIFKTRMLPCFNYLWDLFYDNKIKKVPLNIGELLTEVGLAFLIMDDGGLG